MVVPARDSRPPEEELLQLLLAVRQPVQVLLELALALVAKVEVQKLAKELRLSAAVKSGHDTLPSAVVDLHSSLVVAATLALKTIGAATFASSATVVELAKVALGNSDEVAALEVVMVRAVDTLVD